jgi:beta-carotene ketolase (CrtW type)
MLASAIMLAWVVLHVGLVYRLDVSITPVPLIAVLVAVQTWLYVGLFIIAHDCMHGSLAPLRPRLNRAVGQVCLLVYAGFQFEVVKSAHHRHHRHAGTGDDPDFLDTPPHGFWPWFAKFYFEYFTLRQVAVIGAAVVVAVTLIGAPMANVLLFWALPGLLSALQLFTFGTYLPHKPDRHQFADRHNARSIGYPRWLSLLTCFHFGYHHEHHLYPAAPWWRLPAIHFRREGAGSISD